MKYGLRLLALLGFVGATCVNWSPEDGGADPAGVDPGKGTRLSPVVSAGINKGENLVWCATFQMAWDRAGGTLGRPLTFKPQPPVADELNRRTFDLKWVEEDAVFVSSGVAKAGAEEEITAGVRRLGCKDSELLKDLAPRLMPGELVFFAMLKKDLAFPKPFARLGSRRFAGKDVPCFGFAPEHTGAEELRRQVRVHHYGAENDFVIELLARDRHEQLLLAKLPELPATLTAARDATLKNLSADAPEAAWNDLLVVPNMALAVKTRFKELEGLKETKSGLILTQAMQLVDFQMDEKGVKLKSEAAVSFGCSAQPHIEPRRIILKPPFVILMKRRDAPEPYFAAWVANPDLLRAP